MQGIVSGEGSFARVMQYGDTVILENIVNSFTFEIKFITLKKDEKSKIAKGTVSHAQIVGNPFGSQFEVSREHKETRVRVLGGNDAHADLLEELQQGDDDAGAEKVEGVGGGADEPRDNRELIDKNQLTKGRENSQRLGSDDIRELRQSGVDGKGVMKSLIENSATFRLKTDFSQEKWIKRKSAKHAPTFMAHRCTSLNLCRAYFMKDPTRTCFLREDSLSRILTMSNVQCGSRVLMADSMNGMLVASVAERLGGMGCIMNGFNGVQPSVDAVRWMDFGKDELASITYFPLCELSYLQEDLSTLDDVPPATWEMAPAADALLAEGDGVKAEASVTVDDGDKGRLQEGDAVASGRTDKGRKVDDSSAFADEDAEEILKFKTLQARQKRLEAANKTYLSSRRPLAVAKETTLRDVQVELRSGFDSMILGGTLLPGAILPQMMKLLKPSSPFVVFSQYVQPLLDAMEILMKEECAMEMGITETWMREYQVLPGRTHPNMHMNSASGFLLCGYRVHKQVARPELPVKKAKYDQAKAEDGQMTGGGVQEGGAEKGDSGQGGNGDGDPGIDATMRDVEAP